MNTNFDPNSIKEYVQNSSSGDYGNVVLTIFNIILFGGVLVFMFVFIRNFISAYKGEDYTKSSNKLRKEKDEIDTYHSIKQKSKKIICDVCGEENDADSKFCKNCGNKMR